MGTAKSQQAPGKSNIFKKENEDHREKIFLSKWEYFEGNLLLFFLSNSVSPIIFSDGGHFLFPNGSFLVCCVCFVPPKHRAAWPGRTWAQRGLSLWPWREASGGQGARQEEAAGRPGPSTPARPLASDSLCTAHQRPGPLMPPSPQLILSFVHSRPVPTPAPAPDPKAAGPGQGNSAFRNGWGAQTPTHLPPEALVGRGRQGCPQRHRRR